MDYDQPLFPPSSPPTMELGEFLDGLLFSPEGTSFLEEESFIGSNSDVQASLAAPRSADSRAQTISNPVEKVAPRSAGSQSQMTSNSVEKVAPQSDNSQSKMTSNPVEKVATNTPGVLHPMPKPAEETQSLVTESQENLKNDQDEEEFEEEEEHVILVSPSETKPLDIICLRGQGGINIPANLVFRGLISSSKSMFLALASTKAREEFAANFWEQLRDKGHRFLKPLTNGHYEVLDYDRSVKKCRAALQDSRTRKAATTSGSIGSYSKPPKKKRKTGPATTKNFDDEAMAAMSALLGREEVVNVMGKN
mmetsp:Transcript_20647/g.49618  ORF Transcript_20647/g.49618 Transcript_20647/m.49618 type:complete len:308 (-) Transcript_20647:68-991(-)